MTADPIGLSVEQVRSDADWILSAQLPDGAIANYTDRRAIWPYLSNMAAAGLARAAVVTGDGAYVQAAWRALEWYAGHEDPNGYVTDYSVSGGAETSTGSEDSTDAYAGTFLLAVATAYEADPSSGKLAGLHQGVAGAVRAILSTQAADGLTWAKPSWPVKYLMDQAETYAGLRSASLLSRPLGDPTLGSEAATAAGRMRTGVAGLWDPATGSYDWAVHSDGVRVATDWTNLYSDSLEQAWSVAYGLADATRAGSLMLRFSNTHPEWDDPRAPASINGSQQPAGYWPVVGFAYLATGDRSAAAAGAQSIQAAADASGRAWPFTPADAGNLVVLATGGPENLLHP